jgi:hypothetical protein
MVYYYITILGPALRSSGQSSWLEIQRSGFDSRLYHIFWEVVGLERSSSSLESREYGRRDPRRWPLGTLYPQKLTLTSLTNGGRSVGIVRSRTEATEFSFSFITFVDAIHRPVFLFKSQLNFVGLSLPHRKHIMSSLRAQQVNAIYRFVTMVY